MPKNKPVAPEGGARKKKSITARSVVTAGAVIATMFFYRAVSLSESMKDPAGAQLIQPKNITAAVSSLQAAPTASHSTPDNLKNINNLKDKDNVFLFLKDASIKKASFVIVTSTPSLEDWKNTLQYEFSWRNKGGETLAVTAKDLGESEVMPNGEKMSHYRVAMERMQTQNTASAPAQPAQHAQPMQPAQPAQLPRPSIIPIGQETKPAETKLDSGIAVIGKPKEVVKSSEVVKAAQKPAEAKKEVKVSSETAKTEAKGVKAETRSAPDNLKDISKLKERDKVSTFLNDSNVKKTSFSIVTSTKSLESWRATLQYEFNKRNNGTEILAVTVKDMDGFEITPDGERMSHYVIIMERKAAAQAASQPINTNPQPAAEAKPEPVTKPIAKTEIIKPEAAAPVKEKEVQKQETTKVETKTEAKNETKVSTETAKPKTEAKGIKAESIMKSTKPEVPKPEVKTEAKPEMKTEVKPEAKPEVKPEAKPEEKKEVKDEAKVKTEVKQPEALKMEVPVKPQETVKPQEPVKIQPKPVVLVKPFSTEEEAAYSTKIGQFDKMAADPAYRTFESRNRYKEIADFMRGSKADPDKARKIMKSVQDTESYFRRQNQAPYKDPAHIGSVYMGIEMDVGPIEGDSGNDGSKGETSK